MVSETEYLSDLHATFSLHMSRSIKILVALIAIVVIWKLFLSGPSEVEVEYEPTE